MRAEPTFPLALLSGTEVARIAYFNTTCLLHPHLQDAYARVGRLRRLNQPGHLIVLSGPTGVGKKRLCQMVLAECIDAARQRMEVEPDYVPALMVELAANRDGRFDWRDHFSRS